MALAVLGGDGGGEVHTALAAMGDSHIPSPSSASPLGSVDHSWSQHLKCHICFNYLLQPHTLACGHSFCKRCLVQLGKTHRVAYPEVPLRYLLLACPTCRTPILAAPILKGLVATTFILQTLVAEWKKKRRKMRGRSTTVTLRSICTQTNLQDVSGVPDPSAAPDLQGLNEEFCTRVRSEDPFHFRSLSRVTCASNSSSSSSSDHKPDPLTEASSDTCSASSLASSSDHVIARRLAVWRQRFQVHQEQGGDRFSGGRALLLSVWSIYSIVVVGVAQPMLPYMIVFTLIFLSITLK